MSTNNHFPKTVGPSTHGVSHLVGQITDTGYVFPCVNFGADTFERLLAAEYPDLIPPPMPLFVPQPDGGAEVPIELVWQLGEGDVERGRLAVDELVQQHTELVRSTARMIATGGELHPYLPKQRNWCQTIGDDICAALDRGELPSQRDLRRMSAVYIGAQLNRTDPALTSEQRKQRLVYRRMVDEIFATEPDESDAV